MNRPLIFSFIFLLVFGTGYLYYNYTKEIQKKETQENYNRAIKFSVEAEKKLNKGEDKRFYEGYYSLELYLSNINGIAEIGDQILDFGNSPLQNDTLIYLGYLIKAVNINHNITLKRNLNDYKNSIEFVNKALEIYPEDPYAYLIKGQSYLNMNEYDKAISSLSVTIDNINSSENALITAFLFRGDSYVFLEKYTEAIQDYERGLELVLSKKPPVNFFLTTKEKEQIKNLPDEIFDGRLASAHFLKGSKKDIICIKFAHSYWSNHLNGRGKGVLNYERKDSYRRNGNQIIELGNFCDNNFYYNDIKKMYSEND